MEPVILSSPTGKNAFPRFLGRYVREGRLMRLEEAIHKMTGRAAVTLGLGRVVRRDGS